jgi:hypothetical protein
MNAGSFDALIRGASVTNSRRALGRLLAAIAAASIGGVATPQSGDAGNRKRKRRCRGGKRRCGRRCVDTRTNPRHCGGCGNRCQVNGVCIAGRCTCPKGNCADPGLNCCPKDLAVDCTGFTANDPQGQFTDVATCGFTTECPTDRQCVGPRFQACCPADSRCDRRTGTCLR